MVVGTLGATVRDLPSRSPPAQHATGGGSYTLPEPLPFFSLLANALPFSLAANATAVMPTSTYRTETAVDQATDLNSSKVTPEEASSNLPVRL